jgi:hypothetical protein
MTWGIGSFGGLIALMGAVATFGTVIQKIKADGEILSA